MDPSMPLPAEAHHNPLVRLIAVMNAATDARDSVGDDHRGTRAISETLSALSPDRRIYPAEAVQAIERASVEFDAVFDAADVDTAAEVLNILLASASATPRLSNHDGSGWHIHSDRVPFAWRDWFVAGSALALAVALSEHGRLGWGRCARPGCARVFENTGSGAPRIYCSPGCGSRVRVARQRLQHHTEETENDRII